MKFIAGLIATMMVSMTAWAGFEAFNGDVSLRIFDKIKCSTGITCTRVNGKLVMVSSPTLAAGAITIQGTEGTDGVLGINADDGDDNADRWRLSALDAGGFALQSYASGSWVNILKVADTGVITLKNLDTISNATDDSFIFASEDNDTTLQIKGYDAKAAILQLYADRGDDNADKYSIEASAADVLAIKNNGSTIWSTDTNGNVTMVGTLSGQLQSEVAATNTTITSDQCGKTFYNTGAVVINLPTGAAGIIGCRITFITLNASNFDINPGNSDQIMLLTDAAGDAIRNATIGNVVTLQYAATNKWIDVGHIGTWSDIN